MAEPADGLTFWTFLAAWSVDNPILLTTALFLVVAVIATVLSVRALRRRHRALSTDLETLSDQRDRAQRALRESEVIYHSLVESLPQSILRKDLAGRFSFANQRFCSELGRELAEIIGKTDHDFFPAELADKYRADDLRVMESGAVLDVVEKHVTPQGATLYVQVMKTPLLGPDGRTIGVQGIFWDVTERVRAEEQLREKNAELEGLARSERQAHEALKQTQSLLVQNEKLASLGHLVAGVAHEINNPLSFVGNNVAVIDRDFGDVLSLIALYRRADNLIRVHDPDLIGAIEELEAENDVSYCLEHLPRLIDRTREGLRRIERIVKELRLFARVDEGDWNEVDLNPGVESSITMVRGYARKKGVEVVMELGALPVVRCRAARIHQVILNLLTNAVDACAENGRVTVRTRTEADALEARVDVEDDGGGIPPEVLARIFDPFFTTKPMGEGTGLGLSISYGIVSEHHGRIEVHSEVGRGSRFSVHLPIEPPRAQAAEPAAEPIAAPDPEPTATPALPLEGNDS